MNLFFKYSPLFYLALLLFLNMKLLVNKNILYGFLALSMVYVMIYMLLNPKIYTKKYFSAFLVINVVNIVYLILFHQTLESFMYTFAKFTLFSLMIISIYKNKDFYIDVFPKFLTYFIFGILVVSLIVQLPGGSRYGGLLGNPNSLGIVAALLFGIIFLKYKWTHIDLFILFMAVTMVLLSGSRNALLGIVIAYLLKSSFSIKNILTVLLSLFLLMMTYVFLADSLGLNTVLERTNISVDESADLRMLSLYYGFETVKTFPLIGNGLDKYGYLDTNLVPYQLTSVIFGPHNSFLSLWIQYGIPMGTFLFLLILTQIYKIYRWKDKNKVLFFIMIYLFVAAAFESYLFAVSGFETMIFWIAFAINMLMYGTRKDNKNIQKRETFAKL